MGRPLGPVRRRPIGRTHFVALDVVYEVHEVVLGPGLELRPLLVAPSPGSPGPMSWNSGSVLSRTT